MEKFDLLVKSAVENAEMPLSTSAWSEFEAKRKGNTTNLGRATGTFFLGNFAAAGFALIATVAAVNFSSSDNTPSIDGHNGHSQIAQMDAQPAAISNQTDSDAHSTFVADKDFSDLHSSESQTSAAQNQAQAHTTSAGLSNTLENSQNIIVDQLSSASNTDKLSLDYQGSNPLYTQAISNEFTASSSNSIDVTSNLSAHEKQSMTELNTTIQHVAQTSATTNTDKSIDATSALSDEIKEKSTTRYVGKNFDLGAPSVFTPNNDGSNDAFIPTALKDGDEFKMTVRSLDKRILFETRNVREAWNGTDLRGETLPEGKYEWNVILTKNNKKSIFKGTVRLLRN